MNIPKHHTETITLLSIITALLYLIIYQYQTIQEYQHINGSQFRIIQELQQPTEEQPTEQPTKQPEEKSLYELQQESGEHAPYESGKLYIPIDTPDQI